MALGARIALGAVAAVVVYTEEVTHGAVLAVVGTLVDDVLTVCARGSGGTNTFLTI